MRCCSALQGDKLCNKAGVWQATLLLSSASVCVCVCVWEAMAGIYKSGYKLLLLRGFDHCLLCLSALRRCCVCTWESFYHHMRVSVNMCVRVGVRAVLLMIGCCMLSQQAWAKIHNPSVHFSPQFLPSSGSLFLICSFSPCFLFYLFTFTPCAIILPLLFFKLLFSHYFPTFLSKLIQSLSHWVSVLLLTDKMYANKYVSNTSHTQAHMYILMQCTTHKLPDKQLFSPCEETETKTCTHVDKHVCAVKLKENEEGFTAACVTWHLEDH